MYSQKTEMVDKQLIARIDVHLEVVRELKVRSGLKERSYFRFFRFLFFSAYFCVSCVDICKHCCYTNIASRDASRGALYTLTGCF